MIDSNPAKPLIWKTAKDVLVAIFLGALLVEIYLLTRLFIELPDIESLLLSVMVYGAVLEELLKFSVVYPLFRNGFSVKILVFVGVGFGLGEQLLYYFTDGSFLAYPLIMHVLASGVAVYYLSKKKTWRGLLGAIAVHGVYNLMVYLVLLSRL